MCYIQTWLTELAGFLANVATAAGVPIAILVFWRDRAREKHQREMTAYLALSERYNEYLTRCLNNPDLATVLPRDPTIKDPKQEVHMNMVMGMLESAFFMYRNQSTRFRTAQWTGWNHYMRMWCKHPELQKRYPQLIDSFDEEFSAHMKTLYEEARDAERRSHLGI